MRPYKRAHALSQLERYDEAIPLWLEVERLLTANPKSNDPGIHAYICEHLAYALYQVKDFDRYRIYDKKKKFLKSEAAKLDQQRGQNAKVH